MRVAASLRRAAPVLLLALALPPPAHAADPAARARAERLVLAGRCDEALPLLVEAAADAPEDARVALLAGQCQIEVGRYDQAVASLERARAQDPRLPDVDLYLGIARFHAGNSQGALEALSAARQAGSKRPEVDFYEGLALLDLDRDGASAARSLERAAQGAPRLDPMASYYAGVAWRRAAQEPEAREALERVVIQHPGTEWAESAERALEGDAEEPVRAWVRLRAGMEWDSNVVFRGSGVSLPDEIGDEEDFRGVWSAELGTTLWQSGPWSVGATADYFGSAHFDVRDYDLQYPGVGLFADRRIGEASLLRLAYDFHYGWLGYDDYVQAHALSPEFFHSFGEAGVTHLYGQYWYYDFYQNDGNETDGPGMTGDPCPPGVRRCGPTGLDEREERDRDGIGGIVGIDHTLPVERIRGDVWGGPFYEVYESEGTEYQYDGFGVRAGFSAGLPWQLTLYTAARYVYRPYDHRSTYPDPDDQDLREGRQYGLSDNDRNDHVFDVDVQLERQLTESFSATVRYAYLKNDSNVAVFDYDRHVVGAYVTYTWQQR